MIRRISSLLLTLCCATRLYAQNDEHELSRAVMDVVRAYDSNSDSLEYYAEKALPLAQKAGDIDAEIHIQRLYSIRLFLNGYSDKAMQRLLGMARKAEKKTASRETAYLYYAIAQVYGKYNYPGIAERYLATGLNMALQTKVDTVIADGYNRMGIIYERKGKLDSALQYYRQALYYSDKIGALIGKAYSLENIAGIYAAKNDLATALSYQKMALGYKQRAGTQIDLAMNYINIGETFEALQQHDSAIWYTRKALDISTAIDYKELVKYANQFLSGIYEKQGNYKEALQFHKHFSEMNDTMAMQAQTKQLAEVNAKYQTEKKEAQISVLNQRATIQALQLRQRNILLFVVLVLLVVGVVFFYLIYNRRKLKEQARLQAERNRQQAITTREVLHAEEKERKRIAADLHDGVGQLLSATLINLHSFFRKQQIDKVADPDAARISGMVTESYDELRAISHRMMPSALLKTGLSTAISELLAGIDNGTLAINFESAGIQERLDEEVETVLYRVTQEAVGNVLKHAQATTLNIQLVKDEDGISLTIEDNGKGFDMKQLTSNGIGLKNIYSRIQLLNGTADIDSQPQKGTLVAIHIPA